MPHRVPRRAEQGWDNRPASAFSLSTAGQGLRPFHRPQAAGRSSPRRPAPTSTTGDRLAARACIMNHRTTLADMDVLLAGLRRVAGALDEFR
jgi:hypothetical protein